MPKYSECKEYLCDLGLSPEMSELICHKYETADDKEGLIDYMLLCEAMVDSCVD